MTDTEENPTVARDDDAGRYVIKIGDEVAGFAAFSLSESGSLVFTHTEIDKKYGGRGLGTTLVSDALADVARNGEAVVPECPFVAKFLKESEVSGLIVDWPHDEDAQDSATPGESSA